MLIDFEYGKYKPQHVVDEVIQQVLIAFVDLDEGLVRRRNRAMREIEEVEVKRLFGQRLLAVLKVVLLYPAFGREWLAGYGRGLVGAEGRNGRVSSGRNVIDKHLAFGLDVDFVWRKLRVRRERSVLRRHHDALREEVLRRKLLKVTRKLRIHRSASSARQTFGEVVRGGH